MDDTNGVVRNCTEGMEYSIHRMPDTHKREIQAIFPDQDVANMLIVPTCQKTVVDLVNRGETVEQEKDHCLERFVKWAELVCEHVNAAGHWIDFIDPCSGLPMQHRHYNQPYSEVDGMMVLQKYDVHNAGSCRVVLHPKCALSSGRCHERCK